VRKFSLLMAGLAVLSLAMPASAAIKSISADDMATTFVVSGGSGSLAVNDAVDIVVEYLDGTQATYDQSHWTLTSTLINDWSLGGRADADFAGGQIVLTQGTTELFKASLIDLALTETRNSSNVLSGAGTFAVVGGSLYPEFGPEGDVFMVEFRLTRSITDFASSFDGRSNVTLVPVPEPATLCLLSLGGLALKRRLA
jgi:hypothetical protein